ncbi:MAG: hypothetical protein KAR35_02395 [Candidatus Heimdallarchaeota archaeon]|nr:hypothetical protein [Candidatus Heimdallarchaeota archaeon]MCK5048204.1 hypothetical protein [Candidatus Heimdallarchaeota archaeon]
MSSPIERMAERLKRYLMLFSHKVESKDQNSVIKITSRRRMFPADLNISVAETARGTGIAISENKKWYSLVLLIPFILISLLAILEFTSFLDISHSLHSVGKFNLITLFLGNSSLGWGFVVFLMLLGLFYALLEYLDQKIRVQKIRQRIEYFLRDAIWEPSESPAIIDIIRASYSVILTIYFLAVIYFAPMAMNSDTLASLIQVYGINPSDLSDAIIATVVVDLSLIGGLLVSIKTLNLLQYKNQVHRRIFQEDTKLEKRVFLLGTGFLAGTVVGVIGGVFLSQLFLVDMTITQLSVYILLSAIGGIAGIILVNEEESWPYIGIGIWFFFSSLWFLFRTSDEAAYAWIILLHLFLIPFPIILWLNSKLSKELKKQQINDPSWHFSPFPFSLYSRLIYEFLNRPEKMQKEELKRVEDALTLEEGAVLSQINIETIKAKGKKAEELAKTYFTVIRGFQTNYSIISRIPSNQEIETQANVKIQGIDLVLIKQYLNTCDQLLWDTEFKLKGNVDELIEIGNLLTFYFGVEAKE